MPCSPEDRERFVALAHSAEPSALARAALEIARIAYPDHDPAPSLAQLDRLGNDAAARLAGASTAEERVGRLARFVFGECGFHGDQDTYYDPRNSFLNDVLARRVGIPISLATVLLEVGARAGLSLAGVGFPGHFLVRADVPGGLVVLDPFFGGRSLSEADLLERLHALHGAAGGDAPRVTAVPPELLTPAAVPAIAARMLRNLLHVYVAQSRWPSALHAVELLLALEPDDLAALRARARIWEALECLPAAIADYERYLAAAPRADDADAVRRRIASLRRRAPAVH